MKILLAVDGSKHSLDAVKSLIEHADWFSGKPQVFLAYVHLPVPKMGGLGPSKAVVEKYYREEGEEAISKAVKLLDKAGLDHVDSILVGQVAETLCKHATANKVDLIYMGTRGLNAVANLVVGSVATKVLHNANVPVLLVK
jgi:nucleotide-binding universal stress UspA family protein